MRGTDLSFDDVSDECENVGGCLVNVSHSRIVH